MDINEEKSTKSQLPIEGDHEQKATKSEETAKENDQGIITAPKTVTIESDANIAAEQVKEENPTEDKKNEEKAGEDTKESAEWLDPQKKQSEEKFKCRPIAFLLGLLFALISLVLAFVGGVIWILGFVLLSFLLFLFIIILSLLLFFLLQNQLTYKY
ncbi:hypothetical protein A4A49_38278 [Nicotiana attenuata]|uniref:Uncharacterized protein n=1 Tax=Nicotiana attenuata TaxID=49451 RepID=A0A314KLI1_NICAT|nr:hypothetical protein A4A49_38278 [Nicotiana attenuata]